MTTNLLSIVLSLRASGPGVLPATTGQLTHAAILDVVRRSSPAMSARLHDAPGLRPFTVGPLEAGPGVLSRRGDNLTIPGGAACSIRVTSLDPELSDLLLARAGPGAELRLGGGDGKVDFSLTDIAGPESSHPLAGAISCERLVEQYLDGDTPVRDVELSVRTPATFREHDINMPLPLPSRVFNGLLKKWRVVAGPALVAAVQEPLAALVAATGFPDAVAAVRVSRPGPLPQEVDAVILVKDLKGVHTPPPWRFAPPVGLQIGFVGRVVYTVRAAPGSAAAPFVLGARRALAVLAGFAFYAGLGAHTTFGMGQVDAPTQRGHQVAAKGR